MAVKLIMLIVFFATMILVGVYSRKKVTGVNSFVLGGRSVGPWLTAFSYGTSYFSAVIFVGYAGQFGWKFGIASTWIGIGNAVLGSLLAWLVLGKRTRIMTKHLKSTTMADFFGKRYGSKKLKLAAAFIVFVFLIPYTASLYNGLSRLFGMAFNVDYTICVIVMALLTAVYVILGGYMATTINDFIQGLIMLGGIVLVIFSVLGEQGGLTAAIREMAQISDVEAGVEAGEFASLFGPDPFNLLSVVILTSLGTWGLPQMVSKFYAIKDEKSVKTGTIVSTFFAFIVAGGCYFLGGFGRLFSDRIDISLGYDQIIPTMLEKLPDFVMGVVVVLVLSASMSTLASLVLTSSSTLTLDLFKGTIVKKMDEKKQLMMMRFLILVFIMISVVIAIIQYKSKVTFIAQLMGVSWGALAGAFLAPFLYGLFWKGVTRAAVWVSFIFGTCFMLGNVLFNAYYPKLLQSSLVAGAFVMLVSLILVPIISLFTKKQDEKELNDIFNFNE